MKDGPLCGITVLDFTWVLAGPHATKHFADMGANVIKVEPYKSGANERSFPLRVEANGVTQSSYHITVNRGKKSLCVNLKHERGMAIARALIEKSDIVIENFSPGAMKRLCLDYESVRKIKPDIIYCSISCFGHWGPYSHKPGYDMIAQAASGWTAMSDPPIMAPVSIGDTMAGMHASTAILAALHHRDRTGQGQNIDISMMDALFSLHENALPWYQISETVGEPVVMGPIGRRHPGYAPYGIYGGKNGYIAIACLTEARWPALVDLMGPAYTWLKDDPRMVDVSSRCSVGNADLIHDALESWVQSLESVEEAERLLESAEVPCIRVRTPVELAMTDPQVQAREMMPVVDQPFIGPMKMCGNPLKFSETPAGIRGYAPFLGEHNGEVLSSMLAYSDEDIADLYARDVLYRAPEAQRLEEEDR